MQKKPDTPILLKCTVQGLNSKREMKLDVELIVHLIHAYMCVIPNEKRELKIALMATRFHDEISEMLKAEEKAAGDLIEKRAMEIETEELDKEPV